MATMFIICEAWIIVVHLCIHDFALGSVNQYNVAVNLRWLYELNIINGFI